MNSNCQILPGIKNLYWTNGDNLLPGMAMNACCGLPAEVGGLNEIAFFGSPECRCVTETENNGRVQKASLKFRTNHKLPDYPNLAFVISDVNGSNYLIGGKEKPFPEIKCEYSAGSPAGDYAGYSYEINHTALNTLINCIV